MVGRLTLKSIFLIFLFALAVRNSPAQQEEQRPVDLVAAAKAAGATPASAPGKTAPPAKRQVVPHRVDIPTIAKTSKGAIVTIVMGDDDKAIALGTGFLVRADGAIVTNYHVIATGKVAAVKFADGAVLPVDGVLAADKVRDLAVIKVHGKTFRTLVLGNSDQIQVGEEVVAIGNPLGLELTVSNGILSGVRRDEKEGGKLLQITAPISHGSSGGPLFNTFGEVIGINAMFLEGGENLNFAIPVNDAKNLLSNESARLHSLPNEQSSDGGATIDRNEDNDDLKDTLEWMQNTLPQGGNEFLKLKYKDGTGTMLSRVELTESSGCRVHFKVVLTTPLPTLGPMEHLDVAYFYWFDLGDIDSARISGTTRNETGEHENGWFSVHTWNDKNKIIEASVPTNWPHNELQFALKADYSARFEKAFRHAVDLCGGKPSTIQF